jgi:DNA topoisomerase-1
VAKALVIVESPTKAKTLSKFLDDNYLVESSIGHIRGLPNRSKDVPAKYKDEYDAEIRGINIEDDFTPLWIPNRDSKKQIAKLKKMLKDVDELYLATDEDREGEAISWHLVEVLAPKIPNRRIVFHEITRDAIQNAIENPRAIDDRLVQSANTRRLLDRLYGYGISPVLWKKIGSGKAAGRVQSPSVHIIVAREKARIAFMISDYWDLVGTFANGSDKPFDATLTELGGKRIASGKSFDSDTGKLKESAEGKVALLNEQEAQALRARLENSDWKVSKVESKPYTKRPAPPFTTSTLQQDANRKLGMSARRTMSAAQRLYQNGLITYMRTDSVSLAQEAITSVRGLVTELYGSENLPAEPRFYTNKVKNAQEAHEAIRPSTEFKKPEQLKTQLEGDDLRLYDLIWKRTVACQMENERGFNTSLQISDGDAVFQTSGKTIEFPGFRRAYVEGSDDPDAEIADKEAVLPKVEEGHAVTCSGLECKEHKTRPPARYTEASLVKELEENGIGRPSTYASIIDKIINHGYVFKKGNALVPSFTAFAVDALMEKKFTQFLNIQFTARMEEDLDQISRGEKDALPYLKDFYFGSEDSEGLSNLIKNVQEADDNRENRAIPWLRDSRGQDILLRVSRFGPYIERGEAKTPEYEKADVPEGLAPDELTIEKAEELLSMTSNEEPMGQDPDTGLPVYLKAGRFGPYVQLGERPPRKKKDKKPREIISLKTAAQLRTAARKLGKRAAVQVRILKTMAEGAEGDDELLMERGQLLKDSKGNAQSLKALVTKGLLQEKIEPGQEPAAEAAEKPKPVYKTSSLLDGMKPEDVTLEDALKLLSLPRLLGTDPGNEDNEVFVHHGRFGPYIKCGTETRSLKSEDHLFTITIERARELLREEKSGGGWGRKPKVLKELGANKEEGTEITLRAGRYGAYVTDGETNASVPKGVDAEKLTLEEAIELIRKRAEKGPARKKKTKKKKAKKKTKKKAAKKTKPASEVPPDEAPKGPPSSETPGESPPLPF